MSLRWRYAPAYGSEEGAFRELTRHLPSARNARLRTVPGYYQSRLTALEHGDGESMMATVRISTEGNQ